mgnify:CR=1 FL=1
MWRRSFFVLLEMQGKAPRADIESAPTASEAAVTRSLSKKCIVGASTACPQKRCGSRSAAGPSGAPLPLNQTSLQQMLDEAAFRQLAHGQAYNHDIRLQRQDIDMYLDRLRTAKPISEQVKDMSDGQLESYFANLGKKKGARPAETDE